VIGMQRLVLARVIPVAVAAFLFASMGRPVAQSQAAGQSPSKSGYTFGAKTSLVLLDIVVRDKKGRPVRDLDPKELQVFEDGERRDLTSFRLVEGRASAELVGPSEAAGLQPDPSRQVSLVTFVFDKLMDGRQLASQAALDFLANHTADNVFMSVWTIDQRLELRQDFTRDAYALKQAISRSVNTTSVKAASLAGEAAQQQQFATDAGNTATNLQSAAAQTGPGGPGGPGSSTIGAANADAQIAEVTAGILRFTASIQREQQGQSSLYPLLGLVKAQGALAGRKTLIYFSEGLVVPKNLQEVFQTAISEANRNNVTVYAVDARGLSSSKDSDAKRDQMLEAARTSQQQMLKRGAGAVTVDEVMIAENAEESLRANVQDTLGELAQSTGGFLIANTNDFKPSMARVATDIGSYYEAAYVPVNQEYDGKFRRIGVKVTRPGVTVQSRSGYFALPPGEGSPMLPFEMPLLTALTVDPPPHAFDFHATTLQFGSSDQGRDHVVMFEVPLEKMTFDEDRKAKTYKLQFSLLALVSDDQGRVVERFSDDYPFEGPLDKLAALKKGNLVFKRPFALKPGHYKVDFVAQDRASGKTSVQTQSLNVLPAGGCALSTISVIRRIDDASPDLPADDPFRVGATRVIPNLDVPISKAQNTKLSVYLIVYTPPGTSTPPKMALEFMQGDTLVARGMPTLAAPDKDGRIQFVGTIPIDGVRPGQYSVRAVAMRGNDVAESETAVTLVP
jgi:VWFA-related protein